MNTLLAAIPADGSEAPSIRRRAINSPCLSPTAMEPTFFRRLSSAAQASIARRASASPSSRCDCILRCPRVDERSKIVYQNAPETWFGSPQRLLGICSRILTAAPRIVPQCGCILGCHITPRSCVDVNSSWGRSPATRIAARAISLDFSTSLRMHRTFFVDFDWRYHSAYETWRRQVRK